MPLTPTQEQVIALLSTGSTVALAAEAAAVHRNTISNWRRTDPIFAQALADARYDRALHFRDLAEEHVELAVATIRDLLADPKTPPSIRLKAALALLKEATTPPPAPPALNDQSFRRHVASQLANAQIVPDEEGPAMHNPAQSAPDTFCRPTPKTGRNESCPCGSGQKFKRCCIARAA